VGTPTAAAYTVTRLRFNVSADPTQRLGWFTLAFATQQNGTGPEDVEGVPLHLDAQVEPRVSQAHRYDAELVQAAVRALGAWPSVAPR
jgi:hypothetical protein